MNAGWYLLELALVLSLCQVYLEPIHLDCLGHICLADVQSADAEAKVLRSRLTRVERKTWRR